MTKHADPFFALTTEEQHNERFYTGNEYSLHAAYYMGDDEVVEDVTALDLHAVQLHTDAVIASGDLEPYHADEW